MTQSRKGKGRGTLQYTKNSYDVLKKSPQIEPYFGSNCIIQEYKHYEVKLVGTHVRIKGLNAVVYNQQNRRTKLYIKTCILAQN